MKSWLKASTSAEKKLLAVLCSFFLNTVAHGSVICPTLTVDAVCLEGVWQASIAPDGEGWAVMGNGVNEKPCSDNQEAIELRWNYAFTSARLGLAGCNYSLLDNTFKEIGFIQIKSNNHTREGSNWQNGSYPGNWTCYESQASCLFWDLR